MLLPLGAGRVMGETYYWDGTSTNWSTLSTWSTASGATTPDATVVPGASDDLIFNISTRNVDQDVSINNASRAANSMTFVSSGSTFFRRASTDSTNSNTLTVGSGGITLDNGSGTVTFGTTGNTSQKVNMRAAASLSIANNSASLLTFNRGWTSSATTGTTVLTLNGSGAGGTNLVDVISDGTTGANLALYIDTTAGVTTFQGSNTFTGGTTLNKGTLAIRASGALSTGPLVINGGTIGSIVSARTISDSVSLTINNGFTLGGLDSGAATTFIGSVDLAGGTRAITLGDNATFGGEISNGGLTVAAGTRTLTLSGNSTYDGATLVSSGTLLITGALDNTAVTVEADGTIGGNGSLNGSLAFDGDSKLNVLDLTDALTIAGSVTFGSGFGIDNLTGIDWDALVLQTAYTILNSSTDFSLAGLDNFGPANAVSVGALGRQAYFQTGSLQVVVIPEPGAALLGSLGLLALLRRRQRI